MGTLKVDGETRVVISLKGLLAIFAFLIACATGYAVVQVSIDNTSAQTAENSNDIRRISDAVLMLHTDMQTVKADLQYLRQRVDKK